MKDAVFLAPRALLKLLREDLLLLALVLVCGVLTVWHPRGVTSYPQLVDWPTIASLAGLILLTTALEESEFLQHAAFHLITRMHSERNLAFLLVCATALLATVLTNDIALLIVVPLTLGLHGMATLPTARLVIFEAMAANAGSVLTPMGNPQNLFLWRHSGLPLHAFVGEMLPLALILVALLLALTALAFPRRRINTHEDIVPPPIQRPLLWTSLLLYPIFIVLVDRHLPYWGLALVLGVHLAAFKHIVAKVDWALIAVFILMFIDLRLVAELDAVRSAIEHLGLADATRLYLAGIALSQLISNVPAAIMLAAHSPDWRVIAYAVNVGGFGFMLGSLANLIALRLLGDRRAWLAFHAYSVPYLVVATGLAHVWLFR